MKQISTSLANKLKQDSIVERDCIIFKGETTRHYIWFNLYDDCYKEGNFIGTFVIKRLELSYEDKDLEFKQKEFNAYKEYKLDDGSWESIDYGTFIVQSVEESDTKEEIKVTAYDYGLKFANTYVTELNYSSGNVTLKDVIEEVCSKCNVELATLDFANSDFIVDSNQFVESNTFGNVVSAVASISCNFAKVKADNKLYLEFKNETNIIIEPSDYENFDDKRDTHEYNAVSLGMSNVDGENVTMIDPSVQEGQENFLTINDNPFAYTQEKRNQLIEGIFNKINGFGYSSFVLDECMYPQLECGDLIKIRNKDGDLVDSIVLRITYNNVSIKLEAPSIIKSTIEYINPPSAYDIARNAQILVDKANNNIKLYVKKDELINEINISEDAINIIGNRLIVEADNLEIQEDGTLICYNATIRNGQLILEDDGSENNASISIKNTNRTYKNVEYRMDLSSSVITAVMPEDFEVPQESIDLILFASETLYYISVKCEPLGSPGFTQAYDFSFYVTNEDGTYNEVFYNETLDLIENKSTIYINKELTLPDDFGTLNSVNPSDYKAYLKKVIVDAGYTYYKANGISAKIYSTLKYTNADLIRCQYLITHPNEITPEDLEFFDANRDGRLSVADMLIIMNNGGLNNFSEDNPGELILDTNASSDNLAFKDADGNIVSSVGINGINAMARSNMGEYFGKVDLVQNCTFIENAPNEIGYWMDGSKIKRRSIVLENISFSSADTNTLGVIIENLNEVINIYGTFISEYGTVIPINFAFGNQYVATWYHLTYGLQARSAWNWVKANIVIEYI